jgi:hypothetical protein
MISLYQTYAVPSGLYASPVWSTPFLHPDKMLKSRVQINHLGFLKHLIKARKGTPNLVLLHELGQKPFHFYWWKSATKFWNQNVEKGTSLMRDVIKSDVALASRGCSDCWFAEFSKALQALPAIGAEPITLGIETRLKNCQEVKWGGIRRRLVANYDAFWDGFKAVENTAAKILRIELPPMPSASRAAKPSPVLPNICLAPMRRFSASPDSKLAPIILVWSVIVGVYSPGPLVPVPVAA